MRYFATGEHKDQPDVTADRLAKGLGIFSLVLGLTELVMAKTLAPALGLDGFAWIVSAYGVREIATGLLVLLAKDKTPGIWLRVIGDVLDVATLAFGYLHHAEDRTNILLAVVTVSPVVILDIYCAIRLSRSSKARQATNGIA